MVKLYVAMKEGADELINSSTALLDSQLLLCHVLDVNRSYLFLNREKQLLDSEYERFKKLVSYRKSGMPLQYITGYQEFMGLDFKVESGVLIPRCDTEILVEEAIKILEKIESPTIADVGCGSGAISVSIAKYVKDSKVYALDIMDIPLKVTLENAKLNNVSNKVEVKNSNMLDEILEENIKLDMVISNPPYIKKDVIPTLMKEVKDFEPITALDGGEDGLIFYRKITKDAKELLKPNGYLLYEIGHDQAVEVKDIMVNEGFKDVVVINDLSGLNRVVLGHM